MNRTARLAFLVCMPLWLAGCDLLGIESAAAVAERRDAEGRAIGGACRHAGRAIEDCYTLNRRADKAAVFTGWREMNDYMRENKIESVSPQLGPSQVAASGAAAEDAEPAAESRKAAKPAKAAPAAK
jgi:hypothetical protein